MGIYHLQTPVQDYNIAELRAGDIVYLSGKIFTARDMAHLKLKQYIDNHKEFGEDFQGGVLFHAGPIVEWDARSQNYYLKAIGPTTSIRMEPYSDMIGKLGIKTVIGKGGMGEMTSAAMKRHTMVYLLAAHGCAAIHTQKITKIIKQYWLDEVGMPEALWVMECKDFGPLIVGIDSTGRNLFEETRKYSQAAIIAKYPKAI